MLFLDTGKVDEVRQWAATGVIDGVTSNPTVLRKAGIIEDDALAALVAAAGQLPVSVEADSSDAGRLLENCRTVAKLGENVVIKVPVICADGRHNLEVIRTLCGEGLKVNATACFTVGQAYTAARAGAAYVSLFWSRIAEEGGDPAQIVTTAKALLDREQLSARLLVGSIRRADDITRALVAGADIVTVAPPLLSRWVDHQYARATVAEFDRDERARRAVSWHSGRIPELMVLDREGVILEHHEPYILRAEDVRFVPGAVEAIARLCSMGIKIAVATNQSCVRRGLVDAAFVEQVNAQVAEQVRTAGGDIVDFFVCPHVPEDDCRCRKPLPGLVRSAIAAAGTQPEQTWLVGDHDTDVRAGRAVGCAAVLHVRSGRQKEPAALADASLPDLAALVDELVSGCRQRPRQQGG